MKTFLIALAIFGYCIIQSPSLTYGCGAASGAANAAGNAVGSHVVSSISHVSITGGKCLYNEANVRMADGKVKQVKHLEVGDEVLAYSPEKGVHPSVIFGELHNDNTTTLKIIEIETSSGRKVPVTLAHSVFVRRCLSDGHKWQTKAAYEVRVGECVPRYYPDDDVVEEAVTSIRVIDARGVRQPVTDTGTIIVDEIVVSCYDRVVQQDATHFALLPYRWISRLTNTYAKHLKSVLPSVFSWINFDMSIV